MKEIPITLWHSKFGTGDGQDMATRGYLRSLLAIGYKQLVLSPRGTPISHLGNRPELEEFGSIFGYPPELSAPKLKTIQPGDPRIGQPWPHLDEGAMVIAAPSHAPGGTPAARWVNEIQVGEVDQDYYREHPDERRPQATARTELAVMHFDPGQLARARDAAARESEGSTPLVGITAWEADRLPTAIAQQLSDLDLLIVPSQHTADAFYRSGFDPDCPLRVIPHALELQALTEAEFQKATSAYRNRYVFYTIGTNIPRKNLRAVIAAYCLAFAPKYENVGLVIKTSGDTAELRKLYDSGLNLAGVRRRPKIALYGERWSDEQIRGLHLQANCWVDATRGEGFGLCQLGAAAMGNPVITTGWGAQTEIVEESGIMRTFIDYELESLSDVEEMQKIGVYQEDQQWANPSVEALADSMRRVAMERWPKSSSQAHKIASRYGVERVGKELAGALNRAKTERGS